MAIYTTDEVANLLGLTPQTIQKYIRENKLHAKRIGGKWYRISGKAILEFMELQ